MTVGELHDALTLARATGRESNEVRIVSGGSDLQVEIASDLRSQFLIFVEDQPVSDG